MDRGTWEREDYRELLELVVIFLGGVVKRIQKNTAVPVDINRYSTSSKIHGILHIHPEDLHQEDFELRRDIKKQEVHILAEFNASRRFQSFIKRRFSFTTFCACANFVNINISANTLWQSPLKSYDFK